MAERYVPTTSWHPFRQDGDVKRGLPIPLHSVSNGEYLPQPPTPEVLETTRRVRELADHHARRLGMSRRRFLGSAAGAALTLAVLTACNDESKGSKTGGRYTVPDEATTDPTVAADALGGAEFIFDVQTHFLAYDLTSEQADFGAAFPQAGCDADDPRECFDIPHYLDLLFLTSDTNRAVISAIPIPGDANPLGIDAMERARAVADQVCDDDRLLLHGQAIPALGNPGAALDGMDVLAAEHPIAAWKVYTHVPEPWFLDDHDRSLPQVGNAFLERAQQLGINTVCIHKGFGNRYASPVDIGPAATTHPKMNFVVYHSGYEGGNTEQVYKPDGQGVDRLIRSVRDAGLAPGANVYAELGSTWYNVMGKPEQAAHVLGKLLTTFGPDRVVWGTDSIWYGSPQSQIEAFRAFSISEEFQDRYGYPALDDMTKAKILGLNSAALYGVEPNVSACQFTREELEDARVALGSRGVTYGPESIAAARAAMADHGVGF